MCVQHVSLQFKNVGFSAEATNDEDLDLIVLGIDFRSSEVKSPT